MNETLYSLLFNLAKQYFACYLSARISFAPQNQLVAYHVSFDSSFPCIWYLTGTILLFFLCLFLFGGI